MLTDLAQFNTTDAGQLGGIPISRNCERHCSATTRSLFGRFAGCLSLRRDRRHCSSRPVATLAEQYRRSKRDSNKPADLRERGRCRRRPDRSQRLFVNYSERGRQLSTGPSSLHPGRDFPRGNVNPRTEQPSHHSAWSGNGSNDTVRPQ